MRTAFPNPAAAVAAGPAVVYPTPWSDPRFRLPAILLGSALMATGVFAVLNLTLGRRRAPAAKATEPTRTNLGFVFPADGVVLCPLGSGLAPTSKPIIPGSFIVLWLADHHGKFVETTWAKVLELDPDDPNRISVILTGEMTPVGPLPLNEAHGFSLSQSFWMTRDCVPEALAPLADPNGVILCGGSLAAFDGPDADGDPDGLGPAAPPEGPVSNLVGRDVELLLVSRAGKGTAWQVTVVGTIVDVGPLGQVPTVRVKDVTDASSEFASDPRVGHKVGPGDTFDVTWDCITKYRT